MEISCNPAGSCMDHRCCRFHLRILQHLLAFQQLAFCILCPCMEGMALRSRFLLHFGFLFRRHFFQKNEATTSSAHVHRRLLRSKTNIVPMSQPRFNESLPAVKRIRKEISEFHKNPPESSESVSPCLPARSRVLTQKPERKKRIRNRIIRYERSSSHVPVPNPPLKPQSLRIRPTHAMSAKVF